LVIDDGGVGIRARGGVDTRILREFLVFFFCMSEDVCCLVLFLVSRSWSWVCLMSVCRRDVWGTLFHWHDSTLSGYLFIWRTGVKEPSDRLCKCDSS
jgi:hypothetical protein